MSRTLLLKSAVLVVLLAVFGLTVSSILSPPQLSYATADTLARLTATEDAERAQWNAAATPAASGTRTVTARPPAAVPASSASAVQPPAASSAPAAQASSAAPAASSAPAPQPVPPSEDPFAEFRRLMEERQKAQVDDWQKQWQERMEKAMREGREGGKRKDRD